MRRVKPAVDLRHRGHPSHRVGQRGLDVVLSCGIGLQVQQRGDDLQTVADAMVHLAQQHFALGGERGVTVARGMNFGLGLVARPLKLGLAQRAVHRNLQQRNEIALRILDQIIGRPGLQRGNGDA